MKLIHEIRDPIHVFIKLSSQERAVLDSRPFQRLRWVHQLALTNLVYPGATHTRFEHSLGVMELATRVFESITSQAATPRADVKARLPQLDDRDQLRYWRSVVRMAALCHDLGHLPFSHAAEDLLLPDGVNHETLTGAFINSPEMRAIWEGMTPPLRASDIEKVAIGDKAKGLAFTDWEALMADIITGDAFGVDRMDYLLRDSHFAGVAYGRFDHYRLIDTMRILPPVPQLGGELASDPTLGVDEGGLHSAEALLVARYYMFSQVYLHPVRRIYDIHLRDYLSASLPGGKFPTDVDALLGWTDNEVMTRMRVDADDPVSPGRLAARAIIDRNHFKEAFVLAPGEPTITVDVVEQVFDTEYGEANVRRDSYTQKGGTLDFPVCLDDGTVVSARAASVVLSHLPLVKIGTVYVEPTKVTAALKYVEENREKLLETAQEEAKK